MSKTTIGNTVDLAFTTLRTHAKGKVDTGATTSSLDARGIRVNGSRVTFTSPSLSSNAITLDLVGTQDVQSADSDGSTRPVVALDVKINDVQLHDVHFNLNDRSSMDSPILVGQNALQQGHFLVDPTMHESMTIEIVAAPVEEPTSNQYTAELEEITKQANEALNTLVDAIGRLSTFTHRITGGLDSVDNCM